MTNAVKVLEVFLDRLEKPSAATRFRWWMRPWRRRCSCITFPHMPAYHANVLGQRCPFIAGHWRSRP